MKNKLYNFTVVAFHGSKKIGTSQKFYSFYGKYKKYKLPKTVKAKTKLTIKMGKKKNLKAKVKPGKNILKTAKKVRYLVSDPKIIKIKHVAQKDNKENE